MTMQDIHAHILPGVDHGAQDLNESLAMLDAAKAQGIGRIIATPHVYRADYDRSIAQKAKEILLPHAQQRGIELQLGYEFNIRALDQTAVEKAAQFCTEGTKTLLLEMPFDIWPIDWREKIYALQAYGMEIVLAHPERYEPVQRDLNLLERLAELDVLFQVDVPQSLKLFTKQRRVLKRLCEMHCLHFAASDAHTAQDYAAFAGSVRKLGDCLIMP